MKEILVGVGLVVLFTGSTFGIGGLGGYIYWGDDCLTWPNQHMQLWQAEVDTGFNYVAASKVQFDNVLIYPKPGTSGYSFSQQLHRNCEVYDPRQDGGQGRLIIGCIVDNTTPAFAATEQNKHLIPWDVVTVDPANPGQTYSQANGNLVTNGKNVATNEWDFRYGSRVLAAPPDWSGTASNTWSALTINGSLGANLISHIYDANNNGIVDGTASEGTRVNSSLEIGDAEFGGDDALYVSYPASDLVSRKINRYWMDASGTAHSSVYIDMAPGTLFGAYMQSYAGLGIAVGRQTETAPIVYYFGRDNEVGTQAGERWSIFAFQDMDGDNLITVGGVDVVERVWRSGDSLLGTTINIHTNASEKNQHAAMDLELYVNPDNGEQILLANMYYNNKLFALRLADNGLKAVEGQYLSGGTATAWFPTHINYFEIDMNPGAEIPEPGTLLLLGTGVLGALGYIRRRRMR